MQISPLVFPKLRVAGLFIVDENNEEPVPVPRVPKPEPNADVLPKAVLVVGPPNPEGRKKNSFMYQEKLMSQHNNTDSKEIELQTWVFEIFIYTDFIWT